MIMKCLVINKHSPTVAIIGQSAMKSIDKGEERFRKRDGRKLKRKDKVLESNKEMVGKIEDWERGREGKEKKT